MTRTIPYPKLTAGLAIVAAFLIGLFVAGAFRADAQDATPAPAPSGTPMTTVGTPPDVLPPLGYAEVVTRVQPSVVTVVNEQQLAGFGTTQPQEAGRGTGFIIDDQGHIVTNEHVVRGGDQFEVILFDGTTRPATLVGSDPLSDLAVVQIEGPLPAVTAFGDSDALMPGMPVLAIGSPLGEFTNTVTDGIVSALNRDFPGAPAPGTAYYNDLIQHNAAINPGNSGGPLFNLAGEVVGVNTLGIPVVPGTGAPVQGLFFAIPSNTVAAIVGEIIQTGSAIYPYLGVLDPDTITPELARQYDLPVDYGLLIRDVQPGSPAADAGIQAGDFIVALNGQRVDAENSFVEILYSLQPGDTVPVTIFRNGSEQQVEVTLGEREPEPAVSQR